MRPSRIASACIRRAPLSPARGSRSAVPAGRSDAIAGPERRGPVRADRLPGRTWRRAHAALPSGVAPAPCHLAGGHAPKAPPVPLESAERFKRLRPAARLARGDGERRSCGCGERIERDRHRRVPCAPTSRNAPICAAWPLSTAPKTRATRLRLPDQTVERLKLSSRAVRPAADDLEYLLRIAGVPVGHVRDDPDRAIGEPQVHLKVVRILRCHRVDLGRKRVEPPAERVDEVASLACEP